MCAIPWSIVLAAYRFLTRDEQATFHGRGLAMFGIAVGSIVSVGAFYIIVGFIKQVLAPTGWFARRRAFARH